MMNNRITFFNLSGHSATASSSTVSIDSQVTRTKKKTEREIYLESFTTNAHVSFAKMNIIHHDLVSFLINSTPNLTLDKLSSDKDKVAYWSRTIPSHTQFALDRLGLIGLQVPLINPNLTSLNLSTNRIDDEAVKFLAHHETIISLDLWDNSIGNKGAKYLADNTVLATLNLGKNYIDKTGAAAFANNTTLKTLILDFNFNLKDEGAKALSLNTTLTSLSLRYSYITVLGAYALLKNTSLKILNLNNNEIEGQGTENLSCSSTLTKLDVSSCTIDEKGARALVNNGTLLSLNLRNNVIDNIDGLLSHNTTLTSLDVYRYNSSGNDSLNIYRYHPKDDVCSERVTLELLNNTSLTSLKMLRPEITEEVIIAIKGNTSLIELDFVGPAVENIPDLDLTLERNNLKKLFAQDNMYFGRLGKDIFSSLYPFLLFNKNALVEDPDRGLTVQEVKAKLGLK